MALVFISKTTLFNKEIFFSNFIAIY